MSVKVPLTKLKGPHFVPETLIPCDFSFEEAIKDPWCGRKWNKDTKKIEPQVCAYHPMTCWSCNPDKAGWTCQECPDPTSPHFNARIMEIEAEDAYKDDKGFWNTIYNYKAYQTRRCKPCNTRYAKVKRYNKVFKRLAEWKAEMPGYFHFRFNTFTTRSNKIPSAQGEDHCQLLLTDFKAMTRRKAWKPHLVGSVIVGEVKHRDDGTCHPHLHAITVWNKPPDYGSSDSMLKKEKYGSIHHIHWCYLGDMKAGIQQYISKYFLKDPVKLGGSNARPRIWMTYGLARKNIDDIKDIPKEWNLNYAASQT